MTLSVNPQQMNALIEAFSKHQVRYDSLDDKTKSRIETLVKYSPGFAAECAARPEYILPYLELDVLQTKNTVKQLRKRIAGTVLNQEDAETALRRFHKQELIRLAWKDLCELATLETITEELSNLAESVVDAVYILEEKQVKEKYGTPICEDTGKESYMCVIALGKFGGKELNFSSDIDLMFVYDATGQTEGGQETVRNKEYFIQLAQRICDVLSKSTQEGFMYRVDTRIRPEGSSGALAVPLMTIEIYFPTYGQNWERQALLKARPVAGDPQTGKNIMSILTPFSYRKYVDEVEVADVLGGIHELRKKSLKEIGDEAAQKRNFKNGYGGIREIEFFVQAVQLLYGGQYPEIKLTGTLQSLQRMHESHLLPKKEFAFFTEAYWFLRQTEHRMQMVHNQQVYELPDNPEAQARLAESMGFDSYDAYLAKYNEIIEQVRNMYNEVFRREEWENAEEILVENDQYNQEIETLLLTYDFQDPRQAFTFLKSLQTSQDLHLQPKTTRLFKAFLPRLLKYLENSPDADKALSNFEKIVESFRAKTALFQSLCDSPPLLELLVSLTSNSHFLTTLILRDPSLMESLGRDGVMRQTVTKDYMQNHLQLMQNAKPNEDHHTHLLLVQNAAMFQSGIRFLLRLTDIEAMGHELTEVADFVLQQSVPPIHEKLSRRYPNFTRQYADDIVIIGLGKLGGREFNIASDCDIILIYPERIMTDEITSSEYYHRWASNYIKYLEDKSPMGFLYHGDARLRPHGDSAPLACSFASFREYYQKNAQFWEKMALSRARVVVGNEKAEAFLCELKEEILFQRAMNEEEARMLLDMRKRIETEKSKETLKAAPGGIIDVEFIAQALVLKHGHRHQSMRLTSTLDVLRAAQQENLLPEADVHQLLQSYMTLREVENRMRIVNNTSIDSLPTDEKELERLTRRFALKTERDRYTPDEFKEWIGSHTQTIRRIYDTFFGS